MVESYPGYNQWAIDIDNFPTQWSPSETLIVEIDNFAGYSDSTTVTLSSDGFSIVPPMQLKKDNGEPVPEFSVIMIPLTLSLMLYGLMRKRIL